MEQCNAFATDMYPLFRLRYLSYNHLWNLCRRLSQIHHGGVDSQTYRDAHHLASHSQQVQYVDFIIQDIFLRTVLIQ